jgi:uncharacterized MAPEG superfamily protein
MMIPIWTLLGFAAWTLLLLSATVGVYRWIRILTGRAGVGAFQADNVEGEDWYKRAMRAHANCIENLPVFGAIVFAIYVSRLGGATVDYACIAVLVARVAQSLVHVSLVQTNAVVSVRFTFFSIQLACFVCLIAMLVRQAIVR